MAKTHLEQWAERVGPNVDLLDVVMAIHTTNTGSAERSEADQERDRAALRWRLDNWQLSQVGSGAFDNALLNLCEVVLNETCWYKRNVKTETRAVAKALVAQLQPALDANAMEWLD